MSIAMETYARKVERGWEDVEGFVGPLKPGAGPRSDPRGDFPTGPEIGSRLPDVRAVAHNGELVDLHQHRAGRPAALVFFRSAVW